MSSIRSSTNAGRAREENRRRRNRDSQLALAAVSAIREEGTELALAAKGEWKTSKAGKKYWSSYVKKGRKAAAPKPGTSERSKKAAAPGKRPYKKTQTPPTDAERKSAKQYFDKQKAGAGAADVRDKAMKKALKGGKLAPEYQKRVDKKAAAYLKRNKPEYELKLVAKDPGFGAESNLAAKLALKQMKGGAAGKPSGKPKRLSGGQVDYIRSFNDATSHGATKGGGQQGKDNRTTKALIDAGYMTKTKSGQREDGSGWNVYKLTATGKAVAAKEKQKDVDFDKRQKAGADDARKRANERTEANIDAGDDPGLKREGWQARNKKRAEEAKKEKGGGIRGKAGPGDRKGKAIDTRGYHPTSETPGSKAGESKFVIGGRGKNRGQSWTVEAKDFESAVEIIKSKSGGSGGGGKKPTSSPKGVPEAYQGGVSSTLKSLESRLQRDRKQSGGAVSQKEYLEEAQDQLSNVIGAAVKAGKVTDEESEAHYDGLVKAMRKGVREMFRR